MTKKDEKKLLKKYKAFVVKVIDEKTIKVSVESILKHPKYEKVIKRQKKHLVDVKDSSQYQVGDKVEIINCKPISKTKKFKLLEKNK